MIWAIYESLPRANLAASNKAQRKIPSSYSKYGSFIVVQTGFVISRSKIAMRICSTKRLDGGCLRPSTAFCWFVSDIYGLFILKTLPNNVFWNIVDHIGGCHSMAKWQISSLKSGILSRIWMVECSTGKG